MLYLVDASNGESVKVEAPNWMMAMSKAMAFMDIDPESMGRWVCTPGGDGEVRVEDPASARSWKVKPVGATLTVVAAGASAAPEPAAAAPAESAPPAAPPPALVVPAPALAARPSFEAAPDAPAGPAIAVPETPAPEPASLSGDEPPFDLAERLFDLSFDIMGEPPTVACERTLGLILSVVPAEAGSVLRGTLNDAELTFAAVAGPVADELLGRTLPFGTGLVGLSFDLGFPILVRDAHRDERHLTSFDQETGFTTRDVLCVPVKNDEGCFGVIQLLNPPEGFAPWHVDAVVTVGRTLAAALAMGVD